jgi:hypothetical protein
MLRLSRGLLIGLFMSVLPLSAGQDPEEPLAPESGAVDARLQRESASRPNGGDTSAPSPSTVTADGATGATAQASAPRTRHAGFRLPDPVALAADYTGDAPRRSALEAGQARPAALAAADFDEDGMPDLLAGYGAAEGGLLTLHRGNVDALFPHHGDARKRKAEGTFTDSPFLSPASLFELPVAPDFLGAGDFDADGHQDVVAAARGGNVLVLLSGDGQGGLAPARRIYLPVRFR